MGLEEGGSKNSGGGGYRLFSRLAFGLAGHERGSKESGDREGGVIKEWGRGNEG